MKKLLILALLPFLAFGQGKILKGSGWAMPPVYLVQTDTNSIQNVGTQQIPVLRINPNVLKDTSKYIEYSDTTVKIAMQWMLGAYQLKYANIGDTIYYGQTNTKNTWTQMQTMGDGFNGATVNGTLRVSQATSQVSLELYHDNGITDRKNVRLVSYQGDLVFGLLNDAGTAYIKQMRWSGADGSLSLSGAVGTGTGALYAGNATFSGPYLRLGATSLSTNSNTLYINAGSAGGIYLRPDGDGSTTGQVAISTTAMTLSGNLTVNGAGSTVIKSNSNQALILYPTRAPVSTNEAFSIYDSSSVGKFRVLWGGDVLAAGVLTMSGSGTNTFNGSINALGYGNFGAGVTVGNSSSTTAGTIRWTGTHAEVYTGSVWKQLDN